MQSSLRTTISQWLLRPTPTFAVRYVPPSSSFIGTTKGRVRADNQDKAATAIFDGERPTSNFRAYVVCDGLGGMQDGERCASEAVAAFLAHLVSTADVSDRKSRLQRAIDYTNREVFQTFQERGGTTIAAILFTDSGATAVAIGDTRIYKQHGDRGEITQLTVDDTIAARVAELKESAAPRVAQGPFGNHLTQFIGQSGPVVPHIVESNTLLNGNEQDVQSARTGLLITTDGAHRMDSQTFDALARGAGSAREMVQRLISVSDWLGGTDNATAMYISLASQPYRAVAAKGTQLGLQIHDACGELQIISLPIEHMPARAYPQPTPEAPHVSGPSSQRSVQAPGPLPESDKPKSSRGKRKSGRGQVRKRKASGKDEQTAQPELDIKIIEHSE